MAEGRELDDWVDSYIKYTHNTEPRPLFRKWVAMSAIAACLQRKAWLPLGQLTIYPNLYVVLVGPPAARKGTAMQPSKVFLEKLGIQIAADESSRQKLVSRLEESAKTEAQMARIITYSSLTIFATELTVFLGYNNAELMTILCKWFDCETKFRCETYAHGDQEISNVWINLMGATTPSLLRSSMPQDAAGSGLISRMIFVFEEDKEKVVIFPTLPPVLGAKAFGDLERINMLSGPFSMSKDFVEVYTKWRIEQEASPPFKGHILQAYTERRAVHVLKLATIFSAARSNKMEVTAADMRRAIELLAETEEKMPQAFAGVGASPYAEVQARILEVLKDRRRIAYDVLLNMFMSDVTGAQFNEIISALQVGKWCAVNLSTREIHYNEGKGDM